MCELRLILVTQPDRQCRALRGLLKRIPERRVTGRGFIAFVESENDTYSQILSRI